MIIIERKNVVIAFALAEAFNINGGVASEFAQKYFSYKIRDTLQDVIRGWYH
jgi:hypothetical protein